MGFFPASFQLPKPFRSRLKVRDGQTDNGHQRLMLPPYGGGDKIKHKIARAQQTVDHNFYIFVNHYVQFK